MCEGGGRGGQVGQPPYKKQIGLTRWDLKFLHNHCPSGVTGWQINRVAKWWLLHDFAQNIFFVERADQSRGFHETSLGSMSVSANGYKYEAVGKMAMFLGIVAFIFYPERYEYKLRESIRSYRTSAFRFLWPSYSFLKPTRHPGVGPCQTDGPYRPRTSPVAIIYLPLAQGGSYRTSPGITRHAVTTNSASRQGETI